jgi:flagellar basal body-associated protein FliL
MQPQRDPRASRETIQPTEARQASPKKANFRVLLVSMALAIVAGVVLVVGFWLKTPARVDASSGGNPAQNTQQAAEPSSAANPQAPASTPTPPAQNQSTP